jgi:hypothetical protein
MEELLSPHEESGELPSIAAHNRKTLQALIDCTHGGTCAQNQSKCETNFNSSICLLFPSIDVQLDTPFCDSGDPGRACFHGFHD